MTIVYTDRRLSNISKICIQTISRPIDGERMQILLFGFCANFKDLVARTDEICVCQVDGVKKLLRIRLGMSYNPNVRT